MHCTCVIVHREAALLPRYFSDVRLKRTGHFLLLAQNTQSAIAPRYVSEHYLVEALISAETHGGSIGERNRDIPADIPETNRGHFGGTAKTKRRQSDGKAGRKQEYSGDSAETQPKLSVD